MLYARQCVLADRWRAAAEYARLTFSLPPNAGLIPSGQPAPGRLGEMGLTGSTGDKPMEVFPTTDGLEAFINENGSITLKQDDPIQGDESLIVIPIKHVSALCRALRQLAKEAKEG